MIYADHYELRSDAKPFTEEWLDLFEERNEEVCRKYGNDAFTVEATHDSYQACERKRLPR